MRQQIKELFEARSTEYITPYYWNFLEAIVAAYLNVDPYCQVEWLLSATKRSRSTYYRFVKRFYGDPGAFWDLMVEAHLLNKKLENAAERKRSEAPARESIAS